MSADRPITSGQSSIKDVAARAGVSPGTVSNVLNRPDRVAPETRVRVLTAIEEIGYVRNAAASRLRALDNRAMGILVIDVGNFFHAELAKGAQRVAEDRGFMALLCDGDRSIERTRRQIDFLESQRVAGVLATGSSLDGVGERLAALRRRGVAMVLVDAVATRTNQCSVAVDDIAGGDAVGTHLLDLDHRRLAFVKTTMAFKPFDDRLTGLRTAIARHPASDDVHLEVIEVPVEQYERGVVAADRIVECNCDAVFCINDHAAFGVMRELTSRGVRIPDDIAVIGYDDTVLASMTSVPLSTVRQPARLVGATAAELLLEECEGGEHEHRHVLFQPELIARASTVGTGRSATTS